MTDWRGSRELLGGLVCCVLALLFAGRSHGETVRFAFSSGLPVPYVMDAERGIEVEIVNSAFKAVGMQVEPVFMSYKRMSHSMALLDGRGVTKPHSRDKLYYSQPYVYYQDVAITRASQKIVLKQIDDMTPYTIGGWQTAARDLGGRFSALYDSGGPYAGQFFPIINDESRIRMLWMKRLDVVVGDLMIFDHYTRRLATELGERLEYDVHWLWQRQHWFYAAFKTRQHRDSFNRGLAVIKDNGTFDAIYRKYR